MPTDEELDPTTEPLHREPAVDDDDPLARVTTIRRVETIQASMVAIHHEPKVPDKLKRGIVEVRLIPHMPEPRKAQMATMSDLGKDTTGRTTPAARNARRHFVVRDPGEDKGH